MLRKPAREIPPQIKWEPQQLPRNDINCITRFRLQWKDIRSYPLSLVDALPFPPLERLMDYLSTQARYPNFCFPKWIKLPQEWGHSCKDVPAWDRKYKIFPIEIFYGYSFHLVNSY